MVTDNTTTAAFDADNFPKTPGGIPYQPLGGSPVITVNRETGLIATETVRIRWSDRTDWIAEHFPSTRVRGSRNVQASRRRLTGFNWLVPTDLTIEPWMPDARGRDEGNLPEYPTVGARVEMKWAPIKETEKNDPNDNNDEGDPNFASFFEHRISSGGEFLNVPPARIKRDGETSADTESPRKFDDAPLHLVLPHAEHTLTWKKVAEPPWQALVVIMGNVNSLDFVFPYSGFKAAKETLLFVGFEANRDVDPLGANEWELSLKFSQRCRWDKVHTGGQNVAFGFVTWNHVYMPAGTEDPVVPGGGWQRVIQRNGAPLYHSADFANALWNIPGEKFLDLREQEIVENIPELEV